MPSLADELAGELDPNEEFIIPQNAGLGLSLADELDLDYDDSNANPDSLSSDNQLLAPSSCDPYTHLLADVKTPTRCMTKKGRASQTSTYYTANGSPGQLSALDSADEIDQSLYQLEESDGSSSDRGPAPDVSEEEGEQGMYRGGQNEAGLPTPNMEEDMIAVIQDQVDDIARFVNSLRQVEPDRTSASPTTSPVEGRPLSHPLDRKTSAKTSARKQETGTDASLERYIDAVERANTASNDHINEIAGIRNSLVPASLTSDQAADLLATLNQPDRDIEMDIVPTPTLASVKAMPSATDIPPSRCTPDPEPASSTMDPDESFVTADDPDGVASPVTEAMHQIITENKTLVAELSQLSESVHLHQSFQTSTTRQIKGLKSTLLTWKEREEMEERAKVAIEQWERSQVERGLRGEKGTREVLDDLMIGFHRTLEDCEKRIGEVRAKYAVTAA